MVQYHRDLSPGTLYITITLPQPLLYAQAPENDFPPTNPETFDVRYYETHGTHGYGREEFEWGVYLHHGPGYSAVGTWYKLAQDPTLPDDASQRILERQDMMQSPRLFPQVVGLISILQFPHDGSPGKASNKLTAYLDWLATRAMSPFFCSYLWAMVIIMRVRRHMAKILGGVDDQDSFDSYGFLTETLEFAYEEVWYGLAGQLPWPILESEWEVRFDEKKSEASADEQIGDATISQNLDSHWLPQEA